MKSRIARSTRTALTRDEPPSPSVMAMTSNAETPSVIASKANQPDEAI